MSQLQTPAKPLDKDPDSREIMILSAARTAVDNLYRRIAWSAVGLLISGSLLYGGWAYTQISHNAEQVAGVKEELAALRTELKMRADAQERLSGELIVTMRELRVDVKELERKILTERR